MTPDDAKSIISMQELDPSPVDDSTSDLEILESGDQEFTKHESTRSCIPSTLGLGSGLGLRAHRWDSLLSGIQRYSTYPPTTFFILHLANTSLIPLLTQSIPSSEPYLLLTRPIYQAPGLEHLILTLPIISHIVSGIALRNIRSARRARLYGAETGAERHALSLSSLWPRTSLQAKTGFCLVPLLGLHAIVNRVTPVLVEGGSSGVGLGYVAHGIQRSPIFWNVFYVIFVAASVWHFVGGWATWFGWRVTTVKKERSGKGSLGSLEGYLGYTENRDRQRRVRKVWWIVNGIAAVGAAIWLVGALGIVGRGEAGSEWEVQGWDTLYSHVPVIGNWL